VNLERRAGWAGKGLLQFSLINLHSSFLGGGKAGHFDILRFDILQFCGSDKKTNDESRMLNIEPQKKKNEGRMKSEK